MCFPPDALPPQVPQDLLVTDERPAATETVLTSADGTRFLSAHAIAPESLGAAVLILPDVRGQFDYYRNLARAFASAGHHTAVFDYFGRTAGAEPRPGDFAFMPHIAQTSVEQVQADLRTARSSLAEVSGAREFVTVGFCFGGSQSYLATTDVELDLAGAVAFYGGLDETPLGVFPRPAARASSMHGPLLALYGGADASIPLELRDEFDRALSAAGVEHDFVVYPGAPHSFFDRAHDDFSAECADAWRRVLEFVRQLT